MSVGLSQDPGAAMEVSQEADMSEYDIATNSQPYHEDLQPRRRQCRIGDTISTVQPIPPMTHPLAAKVYTQDTCDYANEIIAKGEWHVSRCGRCEKLVEECKCDERLD